MSNSFANNGSSIDNKIFCNGSYKLEDQSRPEGFINKRCWKEEGHGLIDLKGAIKKSCDCYFYNLAKLINVDSLSEFSKNFSLGVSTRIDIPNELVGIMPNRKWKKKNKGIESEA